MRVLSTALLLLGALTPFVTPTPIDPTTSVLTVDSLNTEPFKFISFDPISKTGTFNTTSTRDPINVKYRCQTSAASPRASHAYKCADELAKREGPCEQVHGPAQNFCTNLVRYGTAAMDICGLVFMGWKEGLHCGAAPQLYRILIQLCKDDVAGYDRAGGYFSLSGGGVAHGQWDMNLYHS